MSEIKKGQEDFDQSADHSNELPFKGDLQEFSGNIKVLEGLPGKVVRRMQISRLKKIFNTNDTLQAVKEYRAIIDELQQKYNISVPAVDYVVGRDEVGDKVAFQAVDKVKGETIDEKDSNEELPDSVNFDDFFCSLIKYIEDKIESGEPYLEDILNTDQFMIGTTEKDPETKIYLVDIEEHIYHSVDNSKGKFIDLSMNLRFIMDMMTEVRNKWKDIKLEKSTGKLVELFADMPSQKISSDIKDRIDEIKKGKGMKF